MEAERREVASAKKTLRRTGRNRSGTHRAVLLTLWALDFDTLRPAPMTDAELMDHALDLAVDNVRNGRGGPFAALVVRDGAMIASGTNRVTTAHDPTAHAEVMAIRAACTIVDDYRLDGCTLISTCEPCPMCMGAVYWARLDRVVYAASRTEAAAAGFDDHHIYEEIEKPPSERQLPMDRCGADDAHRPFDTWAEYDERVEY